MLALPAGVGTSLLLLRLLHIEQDALMYARYELHFLQELCCNLLNIIFIIIFTGQCTHIVVSSKTR